MLFKPYMSKAVLQTSFSQQQRIMTNAQYNKNICQDHDALLHSIPSLYDSYSRCLVCKQPYSYTFTLSLRARRGSTCIGCARLLGPYKHDLETREMIIEMLSVVPQNYNVQKTAEVAETIDKQEASVRLKETFEQLEEPMQPMFEHSYRGYEDLAARSRRTMKVRLRKTGRHGYIPSREELIQLMKASQGRCAVSGIKGHWGLQRPSFF
ncbi:uncharacterized protein B0P05DRAFT_601038, partial [Gilbertella persicaria]|uniref:uncharacterized protein n=1 Tax=Gilbertella persicaria TaxID=101096 RepID=UPI00221E8EC4